MWLEYNDIQGGFEPQKLFELIYRELDHHDIYAFLRTGGLKLYWLFAVAKINLFC